MSIVTWKCQRCGFDNPTEIETCQGGCGYARVARRVVLRSQATGSECGVNITTLIGRRILAGFADPEAVYASEPQFELVRQPGGWVLRHVHAARNMTHFDGRPLGDESVPLRDGGVITVGPTRLPLKISLEY